MNKLKKVSINRIQMTVNGKKQTIILPNKIFITDPKEYKPNYINILQEILDGINTLETTNAYTKRTGEIPKSKNMFFGYILPFNLNDYPEYVNAKIGKEKFQAILLILAEYYHWPVEKEDNKNEKDQT